MYPRPDIGTGSGVSGYDIVNRQRILITGASGFIGRHLLHLLAAQNAELHAVQLSGCPATGAEVHWHQIDLLQSDAAAALIALIEPTHLVHLAWYAEPGKYWTSPLNLRWLEATTRLVEAFCLGGGTRMVMAGTCAEYDWNCGYCREETTPLRPATLYGVAKDATRRLVMALSAQYQVPCAWGRVFIPYGEGEAPQRLIPSLCSIFRDEKEPFPVNATGYRDFMHVSDVASGLLALLNTDSVGIYNISSGHPVQIAMLVRTVAELLNKDPQPLLALALERPEEPPLLVGDNRKLKALGWEPRLSLTEGLMQNIGHRIL